MSYKVNYAGIQLDEYIDILNVSRSILPPRDNKTISISGINGEYYLGYTYSPKYNTL